MSRLAAHSLPHRHSLRRFAAAGRRAVAWIMLAALMLQVAAFASAPAMAEPLASPDRFEVCTVAGMVMLDSRGLPSPQAADRHTQLCTFCLPLMHGGSLAVHGGMVLPLPLTLPLAQASPPAAAIAAAPLLLAGAASPQAPPVL